MAKPTDEQRRALSQIALKEATDRTCPRCRRRNALRRNWSRELDKMVLECSWPSCRHVDDRQ